jgi:hypothetical protein
MIPIAQGYAYVSVNMNQIVVSNTAYIPAHNERFYARKVGVDVTTRSSDHALTRDFATVWLSRPLTAIQTFYH